MLRRRAALLLGFLTLAAPADVQPRIRVTAPTPVSVSFDVVDMRSKGAHVLDGLDQP